MCADTISAAKSWVVKAEAMGESSKSVCFQSSVSTVFWMEALASMPQIKTPEGLAKKARAKWLYSVSQSGTDLVG
eukprot:8444728-Prorocentrum_lima.AAC.1